MTDVLILYEHRNRELENASLIATELEYRGYTVKIRCIYSLAKYFIKPRLLIVPHLYNDQQLISFGKNFWKGNQAIIDMQYEQVLRKNQREGIHNPKGQAIYAQHTAWGQAQKDVFLSHQIPPENIHIVGHVAMDLMRSEFDHCFKSKSEVAREFGLDSSKRWILLISTFAYKTKTKEELEDSERIAPGTGVIRTLSVRAQSVIVDWLVKAAETNKDIIVIYRRHPAEREDPELLELEKKVPNFRCIDKYSIRQWIRIADNLYTWYSTSIADAYYGNKMCYILRPEPVPEEFELEIMMNSDSLETYSQFIESLTSEYNKFPISDEIMKYYYGQDREQINSFAFMKLADLCEKVMKNKQMQHVYQYGKSRIDMHNYGKITMILKDYIHGLLFEICTKINFSVPMALQKKKGFKDIVYYCKEGYHFKQDIAMYKKRFQSFIKKLHIKE